MSTTLLWAALAGGELLLILFLALLASWLRNRQMRRRDRKAIKLLVADAKNRKDQRLLEIGEFLSRKYALDGDAKTEAAQALYKSELGMVQAFANVYLRRDAQSAANFYKPVEDGFGAFWSAMPDASPLAESDESGVPEEGGEMDYLRTENQRLSSELRVAMDTLSRMLNEYSEVFSKDAELGDIKVVEGEPAAEEVQEAVPAEAAEATREEEQPPEDDVDAILAAASPESSAEGASPAPEEADDASTLDLSLDEEDQAAEVEQLDEGEVPDKQENTA